MHACVAVMYPTQAVLHQGQRVPPQQREWSCNDCPRAQRPAAASEVAARQHHSRTGALDVSMASHDDDDLVVSQCRGLRPHLCSPVERSGCIPQRRTDEAVEAEQIAQLPCRLRPPRPAVKSPRLRQLNICCPQKRAISSVVHAPEMQCGRGVLHALAGRGLRREQTCETELQHRLTQARSLTVDV